MTRLIFLLYFLFSAGYIILEQNYIGPHRSHRSTLTLDPRLWESTSPLLTNNKIPNIDFLIFSCKGCGVWTQKHAFFNSYFSPGGEKNPAMEGFIRFWTFIIIFQVFMAINQVFLEEGERKGGSMEFSKEKNIAKRWSLNP